MAKDEPLLIKSGNVSDWIGYHARVTPEKCATIDLASSRRQTYAQMHYRVGCVAGMLNAYGIKKGDRVAFFAVNSSDILDIIFACWRMGAVCLALNYRLTANELKFIIDDSQPKILFYDHEFPKVITELQSSVQIDHWVEFDGLGGVSTFEKGIASASAITNMVPQDYNDQCMLMYSSGTTGRPKGIIITHGMMFFSALNGVPLSRLTSEAVCLTLMPIFHIGGLNVSCCPVIHMGATTVIMRYFDPELTLDVINDSQLGVNHLFAVPAAYNAMSAHPKAQTTDFSRIVTAIAGAETVPPALIKWWYDNGIVLQEGYGQTESAASATLLPRENVPKMAGSAGQGLMHTEIVIVSSDGTPALANHPGEIWMRGPTITPGYWNNSKATKASFHGDWFKSGDVGRMDQNGFLFIEDRLTDMYISGGENIYPAEIENTLYEMPSIREVAVVGVPDSEWGEVGCAVIVLKDGVDFSKKQVEEYLENRLAKFKHPKHFVIQKLLPRGATGKVLKYELRELFAGNLDSCSD